VIVGHKSCQVYQNKMLKAFYQSPDHLILIEIIPEFFLNLPKGANNIKESS